MNWKKKLVTPRNKSKRTKVFWIKNQEREIFWRIFWKNSLNETLMKKMNKTPVEGATTTSKKEKSSTTAQGSRVWEKKWEHLKSKGSKWAWFLTFNIWWIWNVVSSRNGWGKRVEEFIRGTKINIWKSSSRLLHGSLCILEKKEVLIATINRVKFFLIK